MAYKVLVGIIALWAGLLSAQSISGWQSVRTSAPDQDGNIHLRFNSTEPNDQLQQHLYCRQNGVWSNAALSYLQDTVWEGLLPYSASDGAEWRLESETPVSWSGIPPFITGTTAPTLDQYASLGTDDTGDCTVDNSNLDLTGQYFAWSDSKYYTALQNASGNFPTSGGLTGPYYVYATVLFNPVTMVQDSTMYALVYTNIPVLVTTGLYSLPFSTNAETMMNNLHRLGSITANVQNGRLFMNCNIADITTANPEWPPATGQVVMTSLTIQFTVDSIIPFSVTPALADYGKTAVAELIRHVISPYQNHLPQLSNPSVISGVLSRASIEYTDADGNFPLVARACLNDGSYLDLTPAELDFSQTVTFTAGNINADEAAAITGFEFSDNNIDMVENHDFITTASDNTAPALVARVYPNPWRPDRGSLLSLPAGKVSVYNVRGELVRSFAADRTNWDGRDNSGHNVPTGIYLIRNSQGRNSVTGRVLIIR